MKYFSLVLISFFIASALKAQEEIKLDEYLEPTSKKAYVYKRTLKKENHAWSFTDRTKEGTIFETGYFKDETMTTRVGHFIFFLDRKKLYEGDYVDGAPKGLWLFYEDGKLSDSLFYGDPPLFKIDSSKETGEKKHLVEIKTSRYPDSLTYASAEVESEFPGGEVAWRRYLLQTLRIPPIALETMKPFSKRCEVQFIICSDGTVCDVQAINSVQPLLDLQAVNAVRKGPSWTPAQQNNRNVKSYKRQPVTFSLVIQ